MQTIDKNLGKIEDAEQEVRSMYMAGEDASSYGRFVVSLVVPYGGSIGDGVTMPQEAAAHALGLVFDAASEATVWMVYDRHTLQTHLFEQGELYDLALTLGAV